MRTQFERVSIGCFNVIQSIAHNTTKRESERKGMAAMVRVEKIDVNEKHVKVMYKFFETI